MKSYPKKPNHDEGSTISTIITTFSYPIVGVLDMQLQVIQKKILLQDLQKVCVVCVGE
jgi:hypothetical protein